MSSFFLWYSSYYSSDIDEAGVLLMDITLGFEKRTGKKFFINAEKMINPHGIIFGGSGSGKTFTLRGLARGLAFKNRNRVIIFDVHGDILGDDPMVSTVTISQLSNAGLQPFRIDTNPEFGGVSAAIKRFLYSINATTTKLGSRMEPTLRRLLEDLFWRNGFYKDDYRTWTLDYDPWPNRPFPKKYPTFEDLIRFARSKQKEMFMGANSHSVKKLETFLKKSSSLHKKRAKLTAEDEAILEEEKKAAIDAYEDFLSDAKDVNILEEMLKYSSLDTISSVIDRLETLNATGLFKNSPIEFDESKPIHRYDLSSLSVSDQKTFINLALGDLFVRLRERGVASRPDTFVFIDEAKNFIDGQADNMITKYFNEVRKYGCGLWVCGQDIRHFSDDIITNAATKLILGVDRMYSSAFATKLKLPVEKINGIVPKKTFLAELKYEGEQGGFAEVTWGSARKTEN